MNPESNERSRAEIGELCECPGDLPRGPAQWEPLAEPEGEPGSPRWERRVGGGGEAVFGRGASSSGLGPEEADVPGALPL